MEEDKVLHGILLKKAKEAQYTNYEIEQLNLQSESLFIRYYLEREAAKIVENTNIEEDVLKKIYEENKELYKFAEKVKLDTIFVRDLAKAEEILKDVNIENFNELKEKNDEKGQEAKGVADEFLFITEIHPVIAEEISKEEGKNVIIKKAIPVQEGFHIIYLKDREEPRQAIYDEAREAILADVKRNIFSQVYNQLIQDIANETVSPKGPIKIWEVTKMKKFLLLAVLAVSASAFAANDAASLVGELQALDAEYQNLANQEEARFNEEKAQADAAKQALAQNEQVYNELSQRAQRLQAEANTRFYKSQYQELASKYEDALMLA